MKHKLYILLSVALVIILSVAIVIFLHNHKHTRLKNLSDKMYALGVAAIETADDYLAEKLTIYDALARIEKNYEEQTKLLNLEYDYLNDDISFISFINDVGVPNASKKLIDAMNDKRAGIGLDSQIKEARDELAKALWE